MSLLMAYRRQAADRTTDIFEHLPELFAIASASQSIIELGVGTGRSTTAFLAGLEVSGGHLWSAEIDPQYAEPYLLGHPQWTFAIGSSLDLVDEAPTDVDVLFIDSNHDYNLTLAELTAYVPRVRSGGVVLLHDTESHQPVTQAINAFGMPWTNNPACNGLGRIDIP